MIIDNIQKDFLCPNSTAAVPNLLHYQKNKMLDALYEKFPKNENNDFLNEVDEKIYYAVNDRFSDYMNLFINGSSGIMEGSYKVIKVAYYQCMVCGFSIPATDIEVLR